MFLLRVSRTLRDLKTQNEEEYHRAEIKRIQESYEVSWWFFFKTFAPIFQARQVYGYSLNFMDCVGI